MTDTAPQLQAASLTYRPGVVTIDYSWDGALPSHGSVALITSVSPTENQAHVRRFGIKWEEAAQNAIYVYDDTKRPFDEYVAGSQTPCDGSIRVEFADDITELGSDLTWTAVISADGRDLEPSVSGSLRIS